MSDIAVTIQRIDSIEPHPNADRLEIAKVLGTQTVIGKGEFAAGDFVTFFPPDILIPSSAARQMGVQKYLKHAIYPGDQEKSQCRVAAARIRGVPSYGFLYKFIMSSEYKIGDDIGYFWDAVKYEPPQKLVGGTGDVMASPIGFHVYTDIQHYYRYADLFPQGLPVRVTEKIHGTNGRVGRVRTRQADIVDIGEFYYLCGSHRHARKMVNEKGNISMYWTPLVNGISEVGVAKYYTDVVNLFRFVSGEMQEVIMFVEIFGPGIQDMTYGVPQGKVSFRVYDMSIDGRYIDWRFLKDACEIFNIPLAPLIYEGPFESSFVEWWTHGPTFICSEDANKSKFKGREGCVITPLVEQWCKPIGRLIAKSVSADYLDRKNAQDNGEL